MQSMPHSRTFRQNTITSTPRHRGLLALSLAAVLLSVTTAHAGGTPAQKCTASKLKASGKKAACRMKAMAKIATGGVADLTKCSTKFSAAFTKAETRATPGVCPTAGDTVPVESRIDTDTNQLQAMLSGVRFVDNGDGTVMDNQTGLQWEQKTTAVGSGVNLADPHDVDNTYTWSAGYAASDATAFTDFLAKLNGVSSDGTAVTGCFAGHCDWRLPTILELQTIIDMDVPGCGDVDVPCIDPIFGPRLANFYWSITTYAASEASAWGVDFYIGYATVQLKVFDRYVRAVRSGS
jgi:Protein of unknown function (DUF1566)